MRVFLDANVLFSASQPESVFSRLISSAARHTTLLTSDVASVEARRNLSIKCPDWLAEFEALLGHIEVVPSTVFGLPVRLDEKDVPLLCAAIRAESTYFVTGDRRDFGHLFETLVHQVTILTPLRFAEVLAAHIQSEGPGG